MMRRPERSRAEVAEVAEQGRMEGEVIVITGR